MSDQVKVVLNLTDLEVSEELNTSFELNELIIVNKETLTNEHQIAVILVDDNSGPMQSLEAAYKISSNGISVISLAVPNDKNNFFKGQGKGWLNPAQLQFAVVRTLFQRFLTGQGSLRFEGTFGALSESFQNFKISNHLSLGYYADIMALDAHKTGFNPVQMRASCVDLFTYMSYLAASNVFKFPFDVSHGFVEDVFIIQVSAHSQKFVLEHIQNAFKESSGPSPFANLFQRLYQMAFLTDVFYLERTQTVTFTLCWPKNIVKKDVAAPSLLLNNIESFELSERRWRGFKSEPMLQKSFSKQDEESFLAAPLPGELPKQYSPGDSKKNLKVSIERMTAFAQSKWRLVAPPLESEQIDLELIKKWLSEYPNANAVAAMTEEDYQEVLGFVLNKQETVEKLAERKRRIEEERQGDQWKQKILEKVMNRVRNMELEDINEFVTVKGKFDEDQSIVKIAGTKEEISNGNVMIRGTGEANQNDEKMVVKSLHQIQNNKTGNFTTEDKQVWNDAKKKIETELAEKFKQIEGNTEDEFEALLGQQLETVLSDQAGIESEFSNIIATEVLDDSMIQLVNEKYDEPVPKNVNSQHLELSIEKLTKQLTTKDSQLERLRSLLAQLKTRVDMLTSEGGVNKNKVLQVQNQQLNDILEKKNQEILKLKSNQPIHSQATDEQVKNLLEEIEDLKSQQQVKNDPNGEELRKIQKNYRSLEKENEILRMRFKALSEKVDQQRQQMQDTRSSDLNALNEQKELGNRQVEKLSRELNKSRQKEDDLSALLEQKNYEVTQLRDNQNGNVGKEAQNSIQDAFKQSLMEKDLQITKANVELKSLREQNEQNIHQIKVLENKIKLGQGQKPSSMTDVAAQQSKQATQDGKLAQLQHRLKQSEKLFAKLDEASKKMQIDLTEKKKESLNLRQENSILKNKMAELERKLGPQKKTG